MSAPSPPLPSRPADERRRWLPWLLSAAVHGALLAWWSSLPAPLRTDTQAEPDLRPIELVELPPSRRPEPAPVIEPTLPQPTTEDPVAPVEPSPVSPRAEPSPSSRRPSSGEPREPTAPDPSTEDEPGPAPGGVALLGLREQSRSPQPSGPVLRPQLPPPVGGQHLMHKVGADRAGVSPRPDGPPRSLAEAGFRKRRSGKMVYRDAKSGFVATLLPDGRLKFRETVTPGSMPGVAEALRVASGQELYQQQKKRLLEQTFELRLRMAVNHASETIDRRLRSLYRELLEQWSRGSTSEAARRAALFDRWDECEEGPAIELRGFEGVTSSELDDKRRDAGRQARQTIERFIRRQLPKGSPQAYTAEELRQLNARRRSRARFAPYD